jgi:hypothetical protein
VLYINIPITINSATILKHPSALGLAVEMAYYQKWRVFWSRVAMQMLG